MVDNVPIRIYITRFYCGDILLLKGGPIKATLNAEVSGPKDLDKDKLDMVGPVDNRPSTD